MAAHLPGIAGRDPLPRHAGAGVFSHRREGLHRVLPFLDPGTIRPVLPRDIVALDGKTLRRSFDTASEKSALHMVSAFSHGNGLLLGQRAVDSKSNEITAIPELLKLLDLKGCIMTIDAMPQLRLQPWYNDW